jgi:hypothetical protein
MFDVVAIAADVQDDLEPLGTKPKFWFRTEAGDRCLFKEARPNTGEDWAEKIACELARLLGLPLSTDPKTISTAEAFGHAARRGPHAAQVWLTRLAEIDVSRHVQPLFDNIPEARMAQHAATFAIRMLELNRQRLLEQYKEST